MTRPSLRTLLVITVALACGALLTGALVFEDTKWRPYLAFGQIVQDTPTESGGETVIVLALHDKASDVLSLYLPSSSPGGSVRLRGPAAPDVEGPMIDEVPWTGGHVSFGALGTPTRKSLRKGMLYLEFVSGSPTLFPQLRGQLFPLDAKYPIALGD